MIQFRFPIAIAHYCSTKGFPFAVKKAVQLAKNGNNITYSDAAAAAHIFVDNAMKARKAEFDTKIAERA